MFFGNRRNNYSKIIGNDPIEEASIASYSGNVSSSSNRQTNFSSYTNEMTSPRRQSNLSYYLGNQTSPSFQQGVSVTISTSKNTPLNKAKHDHRWDHIEDLDQVLF